MAVGQVEELRGGDQRRDLVLLSSPEHLRHRPKTIRVVRPRPRGPAQELRSDQQLLIDVLPCLETAEELAVPGREHIDPPVNPETPHPGAVGSEDASPSVVSQRLHPDLEDIVVPVATHAKHCSESVVAVCEDVGLDLDEIPHRPLGGETSRVDARLHVVDDDTTASVPRFHPDTLPMPGSWTSVAERKPYRSI